MEIPALDRNSNEKSPEEQKYQPVRIRCRGGLWFHHPSHWKYHERQQCCNRNRDGFAGPPKCHPDAGGSHHLPCNR